MEHTLELSMAEYNMEMSADKTEHHLLGKGSAKTTELGLLGNHLNNEEEMKKRKQLMGVAFDSMSMIL